MDAFTLALAKKYTDETVQGGGAVAGKNCVIDKIESISGGNRVTFKWTLDDGTVKTGTMDVMNGATGATGATGVGIQSVAVDSSKHLQITYTNGNTIDAGEIDVSSKATKVSGATSGHLASLTSGGDLQDSGKKASDFLAKLDELATTELTIYVDYANGSDENDGLTEETPIKTFDFQALRNKYPLYSRFTVLFMSDYTGDITVENFTCIVFKSKDVVASNWETNSYTINGKFVLNNINEVFLQFLKVASVGTGAGTDIYIQNCGVAYTGYLQVTNSSGATVNGRDIRAAKCANFVFRDIILKNESTGNRYGFSFESSNVFAFGKPNSTKMTNITFGSQ